MTTYEKTGTLPAGTNLSGITAAAAGSAAMIGVAWRMMTESPHPEPGLHPEHKHYDFVAGGVMFACGVVGLAAVTRAAWDRFSSHEDVL